MPKLRIGLLIESIHRHGGLERRTCQLAKGLMAAGHEVHIFANRWEKDASLGSVFHRVPIIKISRAMKDLSFAWFSFGLSRLYHLDVVHTQTRVFRYDVATLGGGCYMAYLDAMGISPDERERNRLYRTTLGMERAMCSPKVLAEGKRIILNSRKCRDEYVEYYNALEDNLEVIYNGVDHDIFSPETRSNLRPDTRRLIGLAEEDIAVLFVGSGFHRKGLDTLVQALRGTPANIKALVLGPGKRDTYQKLASDLGIADQLIWAGQSDDVTRHYAAADVFVLPTRYDPFANSTLEALACGVPVITTTSNGVSEILHDGIDGFIVERDSPQDIAERLLALADDENLRERIGSAGHKAVEPYTWQRTAEQTMAVYDAIMADRGAA